MTSLHKILPVFFLPFGVTFILILVGLFLRRRALIWAGIVILWLSSTPLISSCLMRAAEGWAERTPVADAPAADAIVVLSAGRSVAPGRAAINEWGDPDRFYGGVELFQAEKAPLLVFTGGWTPGHPNAPLEGEILAGCARTLGVPADRIITTGLVTNTEDEARAVTALLRGRQKTLPRILLVTSAFHMPRAQQLFVRAGLVVLPFPVDFQYSRGDGLSLMDFLPSSSALGQTQTAVREAYGILFYRARSL